MDEIMNILIKLAAMVLTFLLARGFRYVYELLKATLDEKNDARLDLFIEELVAAAEQMFKKDDPDGIIRLEYVEDSLIDAGYEITEAVRALIESKVFEVNLAKTNAAVIKDE